MAHDRQVHPAGGEFAGFEVDDGGAGGMKPPDLKLAFKDFTVAIAGKAPVKNAIGYVRKGGLTAILGPSASGKSVMLKALAGHNRNLVGATISGSVFLDGAPFDSHGLALSPQGNGHLIGVLTVKECLHYSLKLKKPRMPQEQRSARVAETLKNLGLVVCQDTQVGTIYKRGISGGQQRRVAVGVEVVYGPDVLCLDEPTSGLDTSTALSVVHYLRTLLAASEGRMGILMTIHQPNNELLKLFDDVTLMVDGGCVFSGTVEGASQHFNTVAGKDVRIAGVPATETFLRLADTTFGLSNNDARMENYPGLFRESDSYRKLASVILSYSNETPVAAPRSFGDHLSNFATLLSRMSVVARRDLTLFHVQYVLQGQYGFMIGALFWQRDHVIGTATTDMINSLLWLSALNLYVFVFKSYYNATQYPVLTHERENSMYSPISSTLSELVVLIAATPGYIPATAIGYFMVGFPAQSFPFFMLFIFVCAFAGDAIPTFVANFTRDDASKALMVTQGLLLIFFIFAGGVFIQEEDVPSYWTWVQAISVFEHGVKAATMAAFEHLELRCPSAYVSNGNNLGYQPSVITDSYGSCVTLQGTFPCDAVDTGDLCKVQGHTTIRILNDYTTGKWEALSYLFIVGLCLRVINFVLLYYPPDVLINSVISWRHNEANKQVAKTSVADWFQTGPNIFPNIRKDILSEGGEESVLTFRDIRVHVTKKLLVKPKTILQNVSGAVTSGRLSALMGPSGSGKTTLLNALSGRALYAEVSGTIMLDGHELTKRHFAYVPQIDALNPNFTVRETLTYAVRLRCIDSWQALDKRVDDLMAIVGLVSKAATRVDKLAGGQLKLLSVAIGLVQHPTVLYLDEPTTGLDSTAASVVMEYLAEIAKTGVVTLLTVHQPSKTVFDLVDDIILLGSDGSLAFSGSTHDAIEFFQSEPQNIAFPPDDNPADVLIEAVSTRSGDDDVDGVTLNIVETEPLEQIVSAFRMSENVKKLSALIDTSEKHAKNNSVIPNPGFLTRMAVLVDKNFRLYCREPGAYFYMSIVVTIFSIFLGTLFYNLDNNTSNLRNIYAATFLAIWMALYFTLISIPVNCAERDEAMRMVASNHCTPEQWCLAQFIAQLPFSFTVSLILTLCFHYFTNINSATDVFFFMLINLWLLHMMFAAVSWNLIETVVNPMLATTAGMSVLGVFFLFAGFFIQMPDMIVAIRWMPYTVATFYSLKGTNYAYFHGQDYIDTQLNGTEVILSGDSILENELDVHYTSTTRFWLDLLIVLAFMFAFRFQHCALFWRHTKDLGDTRRGTPACHDKDLCRDVCGC